MKHNKRRILIVDDDDKHLVVTRDLLELEGYEVITHQNGFGVTNLVGLVRPDLVLLDVNMPALSGDSLALLLKSNENTKRVPIVFYSSNDEDSLRSSASAYGVRGYICKGDIHGLRSKVRSYLALSRDHA